MEYTFKFTEQEANVILNALAQRPYYEVFEIVTNIQSQARQQEQKENFKNGTNLS